jgi:hypothetical protein
MITASFVTTGHISELSLAFDAVRFPSLLGTVENRRTGEPTVQNVCENGNGTSKF